ncbi:MAG TPA: DUF3037 domain-containing protein [Cyclobacteriaceae bacterium]|jgi:hypothetical protein|nr:DUF3037 domain-containing protein [Cyclobacteriaceae bacterium]
MPSHVFEYAIIRVVPKVEREEFVNVGVILYCGPLKFLKTKVVINEARIHAFCKAIELDEVRGYIQSFERVSAGGKGSGPIGELAPAERFRWLTATRSTVVQTSKVHPGITDNPEDVLERLFEQHVL